MSILDSTFSVEIKANIFDNKIARSSPTNCLDLRRFDSSLALVSVRVIMFWTIFALAVSTFPLDKEDLCRIKDHSCLTLDVFSSDRNSMEVS
eukprot:18069_6